MQDDEKMAEIIHSLSEKQLKLRIDCERKNALLKRTLIFLQAHEWEIDIGLLADVEKEIEGKL